MVYLCLQGTEDLFFLCDVTQWAQLAAPAPQTIHDFSLTTLSLSNPIALSHHFAIVCVTK
jgi:hypothetical protein